MSATKHLVIRCASKDILDTADISRQRDIDNRILTSFLVVKKISAGVRVESGHWCMTVTGRRMGIMFNDEHWHGEAKKKSYEKENTDKYTDTIPSLSSPNDQK